MILALGTNPLPHNLKKYGKTMRTAPITTIKIVLETKYGKTIKQSPQISGTTALCCLP